MLGIIGAMDEEINVIINELDSYIEKIICGSTFYIGKIFDQEVVVVKSGIGKVNASMITMILINEFNIQTILFSGVAGALSSVLNVGDIVISKNVMHHDFDATAFGYQIGEIPRDDVWKYETDEKLTSAMEKTELNVHYGNIVSGDQFINDHDQKIELGKKFNALCVDMESAAVAQVCTKLGTNFMIIRSISDSLTNDSNIEYEEFLHQAAENSKKVLFSLLKNLKEI